VVLSFVAYLVILLDDDSVFRDAGEGDARQSQSQYCPHEVDVGGLKQSFTTSSRWRHARERNRGRKAELRDCHVLSIGYTRNGTCGVVDGLNPNTILGVLDSGRFNSDT
jgi:hypothetical protein